ncbi:MAG: HAMP domain-containing histidine kinase [Bacteroidales bacterium]|nr:HAMP domain-containing histidine kinase [Bacteroidales bacterium]MBN2633981.1 HAMP domain-containing histidine kinase [Bacteroidales bacterium]
MLKLQTKLSLFNLLSKLIFTALFLVFMPYIMERINLRQVDEDLIQKREQFISLISDIGIEPFMTTDSSFGSFNIIKEEFISLEMTDMEEDYNFIEETIRDIDNEEIEYRVLNYTFEIDGQKYLLEVGKSLESIERTERNINRVLIPFLLFIIIITFLTDTQYTRYILFPLEKIKKKLKRIPDPSHFDSKPVQTSTSDFRRLDDALCEVMENLNQMFQKEKDITVNISHELMTPISVLRSKLENLMMKDDTGPEISSKIEDSLRTLHRLQSLVSSLLLIARIESNQYLKEDSFKIKDIVDEIIAELAPVAEDASIDLSGNMKSDCHVSKANRSLLFSMFYNIVNNALKNTPAHGKVIISCAREQKRFIVSVSDTGTGLTEEQKQNLFSRFKARDKNSGEGTGIGLAIAKTIADFHNIGIKVESEIEKGTTFSFTFSENS